jgi:NADH-quinone oxidoreductase subunit C
MAWAEEVAEAFDAGLVEGEATYDEGFGPLTVTVPAERWTDALRVARDTLGCGFFDWLSAVDELAEGFSVLCHLAALDSSAVGRGEPSNPSQTNPGVRHLLLRTTLPREQPVLASAVATYAGAAWHERETTEMFGIAFTDASAVGRSDAPEEAPTTREVRHLLLPEEFEGHPLRKDFVLTSRVVKPFPGAKEPGESDEGGGPPSRRRTRPPGVPDPESWGPREPGSVAPDPLAHAQPGAGRPRRTPRPRSERTGEGEARPGEGEQDSGPEGSDG